MSSSEQREIVAAKIEVYTEAHNAAAEKIARDELLSPQVLKEIAIGSLQSKASLVDLDNFLGEESRFRKLRHWFGESALRKGLGSSSEWLAQQLERDIAKIDRLVETQLNAVLHARLFQSLEASWRGVEYLVDKKEENAGAPIVIRLLNVSWLEIRKDIESESEFDQSQLFKKIYEEGIGTPGADPFSVLIADFSIHPRPSREHPFDDLYLLRSLSQIAAAAFCPLVINADPSMFSIDSFCDLKNSIDVESLHSNLDFFAWQRFRETEDSRFVSLALPRMLMRRPYRDTYDLGFPFRETVSSRDDYLWGGAAFASGEVLMRAFADSRWFGNIRGAQRGVVSGGLVSGPVFDKFSTEPGNVAAKAITDLAISDEFERVLAAAGFLPLSACKDMPAAAFYSCASAQKAKIYNSEEANANARLSSLLNYILCVSRFAHYLKIIARDQIGTCSSPEELQNLLMNWIIQYVTPDEAASPMARAKQPLMDAEVKIRSIPGAAGTYGCVLHLAPHYELDDMKVSIRLDTQMTQANSK